MKRQYCSIVLLLSLSINTMALPAPPVVTVGLTPFIPNDPPHDPLIVTTNPGFIDPDPDQLTPFPIPNPFPTTIRFPTPITARIPVFTPPPGSDFDFDIDIDALLDNPKLKLPPRQADSSIPSFPPSPSWDPWSTPSRPNSDPTLATTSIIYPLTSSPWEFVTTYLTTSPGSPSTTRHPGYKPVTTTSASTRTPAPLTDWEPIPSPLPRTSTNNTPCTCCPSSDTTVIPTTHPIPATYHTTDPNLPQETYDPLAKRCLPVTYSSDPDSAPWTDAVTSTKAWAPATLTRPTETWTTVIQTSKIGTVDVWGPYTGTEPFTSGTLLTGTWGTGSGVAVSTSTGGLWWEG